MVFGGAERRGLGGMRWNVQCMPPARLPPQYYSLQNTSRRSHHIPSALHPQKLGLDADEVGDGDGRPLALTSVRNQGCARGVHPRRPQRYRCGVKLCWILRPSSAKSSGFHPKYVRGAHMAFAKWKVPPPSTLFSLFASTLAS